MEYRNAEFKCYNKSFLLSQWSAHGSLGWAARTEEPAVPAVAAVAALSDWMTHVGRRVRRRDSRRHDTIVFFFSPIFTLFSPPTKP